mmetsp:Transcript_47972/g.95447  ORF Transcript_47972/g.95447 Transcript_47972/m.95447 type:complete len:545 (-) Transcript_47972:186-1820(-)
MSLGRATSSTATVVQRPMPPALQRRAAMADVASETTIESAPPHGKAGAAACVAAIAACTKLDDSAWFSALALLSEAQSRSTELCLEAFAGAAALCKRAKKWRKVSQLLDDAWDAGLIPDGKLYADAIAARGALGEWEYSLWLLRDGQQQDIEPCSEMCIAAIAACGKAEAWTRAWQQALELLNSTYQLQLQPSSAPVAAAVWALPDEKWRIALSLLEELPRRHVALKYGCCKAMISACSRGKQWAAACQLLEDAQRHSLAGNALYSTALRSFTIPNVWTKTWEIALAMFFVEMRERHITPDAAAYSATLFNCPGNFWRLALRLLHHMTERSMSVGEREHVAALNVCARTGQAWRSALALLKVMKGAALEMSQPAYTAAIQAMVKSSRWTVALDLFHEGKKMFRSASKESLYGAALRACRAERNWFRALQLSFEMQQDSVTPTVDTYIRLLDVSEECERWEWSRQLMDTLENLNAPRKTSTYNAALNACLRSQQWTLALELLWEMRYDGVPENAKTYAIAMETCEKAGKLDVAMKLLDEADNRRA